MAAESPGIVWAAIWEEGVWATGVWAAEAEPVPEPVATDKRSKGKGRRLGRRG